LIQLFDVALQLDEMVDFIRCPRVRGLPPAPTSSRYRPRAQKRMPQSVTDDPLICRMDVSGGGAGWNVCAFRRGGDARSVPPIRIPGQHTRDRNVLVGKLADMLRDTRPGSKVTAMFIDMAFGLQIYERLRALGFRNVFEVNFGLTHTPDHQANMWREMKDWLLTNAIETDEKMTMDLAGPGPHINRSKLLVAESKVEMQKRGQASPDDSEALALTFAQEVAPAEVEEQDEEYVVGRCGINGPGAWMGRAWKNAPGLRCRLRALRRFARRNLRSDS
jgi:phage terminase large subunit